MVKWHVHSGVSFIDGSTKMEMFELVVGTTLRKLRNTFGCFEDEVTISRMQIIKCTPKDA